MQRKQVVYHFVLFEDFFKVAFVLLFVGKGRIQIAEPLRGDLVKVLVFGSTAGNGFDISEVFGGCGFGCAG